MEAASDQESYLQTDGIEREDTNCSASRAIRAKVSCSRSSVGADEGAGERGLVGQ